MSILVSEKGSEYHSTPSIKQVTSLPADRGPHFIVDTCLSAACASSMSVGVAADLIVSLHACTCFCVVIDLIANACHGAL